MRLGEDLMEVDRAFVAARAELARARMALVSARAAPLDVQHAGLLEALDAAREAERRVAEARIRVYTAGFWPSIIH